MISLYTLEKLYLIEYNALGRYAKINLPRGLFYVKHLYGKMQSNNWITAKDSQMYIKGGKIVWQKK